jgi:hypothetical protein
MAETIETALGKNSWTDISSALTTGTTYTIQNTGATSVRIFESTNAPPGNRIGYLLSPNKFTQIKPAVGFTIYCRPARNAGKVTINISV